MLNSYLLVQTNGHVIGCFNREFLGFVFIPVELISCPCVTELNAQNIVLSGLHEGGLYQGSIPLHGVMVDEVPHFQCSVGIWLE